METSKFIELENFLLDTLFNIEDNPTFIDLNKLAENKDIKKYHFIDNSENMEIFLFYGFNKNKLIKIEFDLWSEYTDIYEFDNEEQLLNYIKNTHLKDSLTVIDKLKLINYFKG